MTKILNTNGFALDRLWKSFIHKLENCGTTVPGPLPLRTTDVLKSLTFTGPYIAIIFPMHNQQDATFLNFVYFYRMLYMFQAVTPPIIRSTKLYIQLQVFVKP
jgi:hypothetical protein